MASSHLIRLGKIKGKNGILDALKHNKRTLQNERGASANINVARTPLNYSLTGCNTPEHISRHAKAQMMMAGIETPRINQVSAVEVIFSLPIDRHDKDERQFFIDCLEWVKINFLGEVLSFDVHLDESAPHAHAVILPLIDGKMRGSDMVGGIGNLNRLRRLFYTQVAQYHGFRNSESKRLSIADKQLLAKQVLTCLKSDPAMQSSVWPHIRDSVCSNPLPFAQTLSVQLLSANEIRGKSFVDIKRSKGKGSFIR